VRWRVVLVRVEWDLAVLSMRCGATEQQLGVARRIEPEGAEVECQVGTFHLGMVRRIGAWRAGREWCVELVGSGVARRSGTTWHGLSSRISARRSGADSRLGLHSMVT